MVLEEVETWQRTVQSKEDRREEEEMDREVGKDRRKVDLKVKLTIRRCILLLYHSDLP